MVQERSLHNGCMALPVCHPARRVRGHRVFSAFQKSRGPEHPCDLAPKKVEFIRLALISQKHTFMI